MFRSGWHGGYLVDSVFFCAVQGLDIFLVDVPEAPSNLSYVISACLINGATYEVLISQYHSCLAYARYSRS